MEQQDSRCLWQYCKSYIRFGALVHPLLKEMGKLPITLGNLQAKRMMESSILVLVSH